ncbi:hypothetical protein CEK00_21520, partial [Stenotrophomonas maltophilia]
MTTKTTEKTQAEHLKDLLRPAEEALTVRAKTFAEDVQSLPGRLLDAEEAEEEAADRLRCIEQSYAEGDDTFSETDYSEAVDNARRTTLIAEGLRKKLAGVQVRDRASG